MHVGVADQLPKCRNTHYDLGVLGAYLSCCPEILTGDYPIIPPTAKLIHDSREADNPAPAVRTRPVKSLRLKKHAIARGDQLGRTGAYRK